MTVCFFFFSFKNLQNRLISRTAMSAITDIYIHSALANAALSILEPIVQIVSTKKRFFSEVIAKTNVLSSSQTRKALLFLLQSGRYTTITGHLAGWLPTIADISRTILYMKICQCTCVRLLRAVDVLNAIIHIISNLRGVAPTCSNVIFVMKFSAVRGSYPTLRELSVSSLFHTRQEGLVCYGIEQTNSPLVADEKNKFSIGLGAIQLGETALALPTRTHAVHSNAKDCLGDEGGSILTRVKRHRNCPNCNTEICVPAMKRK